MLGVREEQRYSTFTLELAPGQSVLLYTDGADEAIGPPDTEGGELYGDERLAASFSMERPSPCPKRNSRSSRFGTPPCAL